MKTLSLKKFCVLTGSILLVGTTGLTSAFADRPQHPYEGIPNRNVFNLGDPPPVDVPKPPEIPPPTLKLQAITTILGTKQVLLLVEAKPPHQPKPESLVLNEKQRHGDIEVLSIDEVAGLVTLNRNGSVITLDITKDASKPTGGPAVPPPGLPQPGNPMPNIPSPGASPVTTFGSGASPSVRPSYRVPPTPTSPPAIPLSREEQTVLLELQRAQHKDNPNFPPLPPTSMTPKPNGQ